MLPVQLADLDVAARVLMALPASARRAFAARLCFMADIAAQFRRETLGLHPNFGNGTLMSAAHKCPVHPRPAFCNRDYLASIGVLVARLGGITTDDM